MGSCLSSPGHEQEAAPSSMPPRRDPCTSFVKRQGSSLVLDGRPYRFASLNAPELLDTDISGPFEINDTFESFANGGFGPFPVTRTYTLRINSVRIRDGHIKRWNTDWGDWEWDGEALKQMDQVLASAAEQGVRLIIPLINADWGSEDTNWVGNTTDLVRYRKNIQSYEEAKKFPFFTDTEMINSVKLIIDKITLRTNSVNGRPYNSDPTILAFETGNELHLNGYGTAPASWTLKIAAHLKDRAPNTLVMDGSFARNDDVERCYAKEVLESPLVDLFSWHYYGSGDTQRLKRDCQYVQKYGKVFVAGEFGFYSKPQDYDAFLSILDSSGGAGALCWSLRPHSCQGGFKTHGEDGGHFSYHVPGWPDSLHAEFDGREAAVVSIIRRAAYKINKQTVPPVPVPKPPPRIWISESGQLCWQGSAWSASYELIVRSVDTGEEFGRRQVMDNTKEGCLGVDLQTERRLAPRGKVNLSLRGRSADGAFGEESEPLVI